MGRAKGKHARTRRRHGRHEAGYKVSDEAAREADDVAKITGKTRKETVALPGDMR